MIDRERVIKDWEAVLSRDPLDASYDLIDETLELLKEQEPRVLTLEEVKNDCPDYVYLETTSGWLECCIKDEGESDIYFGRFACGIDDFFMKQWSEYGKTWWCWSARPTDEQRKAVKWEC